MAKAKSLAATSIEYSFSLLLIAVNSSVIWFILSMHFLIALKINQVKSIITIAKVQYDESLIQDFTSNPKVLYGYIRDKSQVKASNCEVRWVSN